jgi:hypothetical protein
MLSELEKIQEVILRTVATEAIYFYEDSTFYVVITDKSMRPLKAMQLLNKALYDLKEFPLYLLVSEKSDFEKRKELPTLEQTIVREGVKLYGG